MLILSDIHGNADALKAVLEHAKSFDSVWVLGDLVDYGPEPHVVIDMVRDLKPEAIVMGNHDNAVAFNIDCGCAPETHDLSEYTRMNISFRFLSKEQIDWLRNLQVRVRLGIGSKKLYIVHASPNKPLHGYIKPGMPSEMLEQLLSEGTIAKKLVDADILVVGHSHIPMDMVFKGIRILNPGSVGQPRDGDPRASYAILDTETWSFSIYRVKYDVEAVIRKLEGLNLEQKYLNRLKSILLLGRVV